MDYTIWELKKIALGNKIWNAKGQGTFILANFLDAIRRYRTEEVYSTEERNMIQQFILEGGTLLRKLFDLEDNEK